MLLGHFQLIVIVQALLTEWLDVPDSNIPNRLPKKSSGASALFFLPVRWLAVVLLLSSWSRLAQATSPTSQPSRQPSHQPTNQPTVFLSGTLANSLVAYYPFDGNANDASVNGNNGVVHSATLAADRFGNPSSAYNFDGSSSYIEIVDGSSFNFVNQFSISFWINPSNAQQSGVHLFTENDVLYFEQNGAATNSYYLAYYDAAGTPWLPGTSHIESDRWSHFVFTKKDKTISYYLNNILAGTINATTSSIRSNNNKPLIMGAFNSLATTPASGVSGFFHGFLDDIFIYNRTLSAIEIRLLNNFESPTSQPSRQPSSQPTWQPTVFLPGTLANSLVAYYPFDGSARDESGNGNNGVAHNVILTTDRFGYSNKAYHFNGISSYIESPGERFNFVDNLTISVWINPASSQVSYVTLFDKGVWGGSGGFLVQQADPAINLFYFAYFYIASVTNGGITAQASANTWNHFVITKQGAVGTFYLNGVLVSTQSNFIPSSILSNGNKPLIIGAENAGATTPASNIVRVFNGTIDDVFIYNRALSQTEIIKLYNFDSPTSQPSSQPSRQPTTQPTTNPSQPSSQPSIQPSIQPSVQPSVQPSLQPTLQPSLQPTLRPSVRPTNQPSFQPTSRPSVQPSRQPTKRPSTQPTIRPSAQPSLQPIIRPSSQPTRQPTLQPSIQPTSRPSITPSNQPSKQPTFRPSFQPTKQPTSWPSIQPSSQPSTQPSLQPTTQPTLQPSFGPTTQPSNQPSKQPSAQPTKQPSSQPSIQPTSRPSVTPSNQPSKQPTLRPSFQPTKQPTLQPSIQPSSQPSCQPSVQPSAQPSSQPTRQPTLQPSVQPTSRPSVTPSNQPSKQPTIRPSFQPTKQPTLQPSIRPSGQPSRQPSVQPSAQPSSQPTRQPTLQPSIQPTSRPSVTPSSQPSKQPTLRPSFQPTKQPTSQPSIQPSNQPSTQPSNQPSNQPNTQPTKRPSSQPSIQPTSRFSVTPSSQPSGHPTLRPSFQPTKQPTLQPTIQPSSQPNAQPSQRPSLVPTRQPSENPSDQPTKTPAAQPSVKPSRRPSIQPVTLPSSQPSIQPTLRPSMLPTKQPSRQPSMVPTRQPSVNPSVQPTKTPSRQPSSRPSVSPSMKPSRRPSGQPIRMPTSRPTFRPNAVPTEKPTKSPTAQPLVSPSARPTRGPSVKPSSWPTNIPWSRPSFQPTRQPSQRPVVLPSGQPSFQPTFSPLTVPTKRPTRQPSSQPSVQPSRQPSRIPTAQPTIQPTSRPSIQPFGLPTFQPTQQPIVVPSARPTQAPTISQQPTMPIAYWALYKNDLLNVSQAFLTGMTVFGTQVVTFTNNQLWLFNLDGSFSATVRVPCNVSSYIAIDSYSLIFAGSEELGETIIGSYSLNTFKTNWLQTVSLTNVKVVFNSAFNQVFVVGSDSEDNLVVAQSDPNVGFLTGNRYSLAGSKLIISSASSGFSYFGVFVTGVAGSQMFMASFNTSTYISAVIVGARSNTIGVVLSSASSGYCYECGESVIASSLSGRASLNFVYQSTVGEFFGTGWGLVSATNAQFTDLVIIPALPWLLMVGIGVTAGFDPNPVVYNSVMLAAFVNGKLKNTLRIRLAAGDVLSRCHGDLEGSGLLVSCTMINAQNRQENLVFFVDYSLSSYAFSLSSLAAMYQAFSNDITFSSSSMYMSHQTLVQTSYILFALPSGQPTSWPSLHPSSSNPTTRSTANPTSRPSPGPTKESDTHRPTTLYRPTLKPTRSPKVKPTVSPTLIVTVIPSRTPTQGPTLFPTLWPSFLPTKLPTILPSFLPTKFPTLFPTFMPTLTKSPSMMLTFFPSSHPSSNMTDPTSKHSSKKQAGMPLWGWIAIGVASLFVAAIYCFWEKIKKMKEKCSLARREKFHGEFEEGVFNLEIDEDKSEETGLIFSDSKENDAEFGVISVAHVRVKRDALRINASLQGGMFVVHDETLQAHESLIEGSEDESEKSNSVTSALTNM